MEEKEKRRPGVACKGSERLRPEGHVKRAELAGESRAVICLLSQPA
jgi:hypothetical protein